MLAFGLASSKVYIIYSRCPCNKLWGRSECLNIYTIEVNGPCTKQFFGAIFWKSLNNFRGGGQKLIVYKKKCVAAYNKEN